MTDKVDDLASDVDDAITSAEELEDDPQVRNKDVKRVKDALEHAKETVDRMEDDAEQ